MHSSTAHLLCGELGIVVTLDQAAEQLCRELATQLLPANSDYKLGAENLPHLTLYQAALKNCNRAQALKLVENLSAVLAGKELELRELLVFGGKFLFWNVDLKGTNVSDLRDCHMQSLALAQYLDHEENARLLPSRPGNKQQIENFSRYGYGLLKDLYLPHVTLGVSTSFAAAEPIFQPYPARVLVSGVALTRMGEFGKVVEVL